MTGTGTVTTFTCSPKVSLVRGKGSWLWGTMVVQAKTFKDIVSNSNGVENRIVYVQEREILTALRFTALTCGYSLCWSFSSFRIRYPPAAPPAE